MPSFACVEAVALFARAWIEILLTLKEAVYYLRRPLCEGVD